MLAAAAGRALHQRGIHRQSRASLFARGTLMIRFTVAGIASKPASGMMRIRLLDACPILIVGSGGVKVEIAAAGSLTCYLFDRLAPPERSARCEVQSRGRASRQW